MGVGEVLILQDFSNLIDCTPQDQVKVNFYGGAAQITAHPSVLYPQCEGKKCEEEKMVIVHVSDIKKHDAHMVSHITIDLLNILKEKYPDTKWKKAYVWSDGCVQQYKSKTSFHYLKKFHDIDVERNYFGTEHGKNESDGITGEISKKVKNAIRSRRHSFNNANELVIFLSEAMPKYDFRLITEEQLKPIYTAFKGVDLTVLSGNCTRSLHQIKPGEGKDEFLIRPFSCFCYFCKANQLLGPCKNYEYTGGAFLSRKLELKGSNDTLQKKANVSKKSNVATTLAKVIELEEEEESEDEEVYIEDDYESDIEDQQEPIIISQQEIQLDDLTEGQFVIGKNFENENNYENFVAKIKEKNENYITVNILEQCNKELNNNVFRLKKIDEKDVSILQLKNIVMILPPPSLPYFNERLQYTTFYFDSPIIL